MEIYAIKVLSILAACKCWKWSYSRDTCKGTLHAAAGLDSTTLGKHLRYGATHLLQLCHLTHQGLMDFCAEIDAKGLVSSSRNLPLHLRNTSVGVTTSSATAIPQIWLQVAGLVTAWLHCMWEVKKMLHSVVPATQPRPNNPMFSLLMCANIPLSSGHSHPKGQEMSINEICVHSTHSGGSKCMKSTHHLHSFAAFVLVFLCFWSSSWLTRSTYMWCPCWRTHRAPRAIDIKPYSSTFISQATLLAIGPSSPKSPELGKWRIAWRTLAFRVW